MGSNVLEIEMCSRAAPEITPSVELLVDSGAIRSVMPALILADPVASSRNPLEMSIVASNKKSTRNG